MGFRRVGGDRRMSVAVLTTVYSLYCSVTFPPKVGKEVVPLSGVILTSTGGRVSLGPPLGAVVVLAQEWLAMQAATKRTRTRAVRVILLIVN